MFFLKRGKERIREVCTLVKLNRCCNQREHHMLCLSAVSVKRFGS